MNKIPFFRPAQSTTEPHAAHMTWASRTVSGTVNKTRRFLSRQLWAWPIIAVTLLLFLGWTVNSAIERTMESNLQSELQTLRDVEVAMLRNWLTANENNAQSIAGDADVRRLVGLLVDSSPNDPQTADDTKSINRQLIKQMGPAMNSHNYEAFFIADRNTVVAATEAGAIGMEVPIEFDNTFQRVFDGNTTIIPPYPSLLASLNAEGKRQTGVPTMFVLSPVVDEYLQVVAVIGLKIRPDREFTRILQLGRSGESGETYAFNTEGLMLSNSRFDRDLILLGLIPENTDSILQVLIRDPGGNMNKGYRPKVFRSDMPLTRMAKSAIEGTDGVDINGYRDYRGTPVVGAWAWLDEYGFGVATEVDYSEAFRPLIILKRTFWGLLALLALSSLAIFLFTLRVARLQRQVREAAIEARQLGQYKLEEKLGEGAMGVVYKGRHAMLRRPTAIKLLNADKVTDTSIGQFEREVQITSHLNHPNTIAIYDYGRTPEGIFYYAMEYLDGIDLQQLVDTYGPQPPGRVIYILRQICGSLYEAHSTGLVHRDIKPANIMLNRRGNEGDVVKVLDFGLVMARDSSAAGEADNRGAIVGTPLHMSPEAIQLPGSVDACSDLYAVGAVGYFLLTGRPVFESNNLSELCRMHISEPVVPPSTKLGQATQPELEYAIMSCLEKERAKRPQTARDLTNLLNRCPAADDWQVANADEWWGRHERGQGQTIPPSSSAPTASDHDATIAHG